MMSVSFPTIVAGGTYAFQSGSNPNLDYTTILTTEGRLQCDCKGWTIKRGNQPRRCKHTDQVAAIEGRGYLQGEGDEADYVFLVPNADDKRFPNLLRKGKVAQSALKVKPPRVVEESRDPARTKGTDIAPGVLRQRRIILD